MSRSTDVVEVELRFSNDVVHQLGAMPTHRGTPVNLEEMRSIVTDSTSRIVQRHDLLITENTKIDIL